MKCSNKYRFSIVTVCYNAVDTIEETIKSVLDQTYDNIEYIIVDGNSNDGTIDVISKYADRVDYFISESDNGVYDAMNKGIDIATGEYIGFMNAGDKLVDCNVIEKVAASLDPESSVIYGDTIFKTKSTYRLQKALAVEKLSYMGIFCHQSAFVRLDYHKNNIFDLNYKVLADFNFFYKAYNVDHVKFQKLEIPISVFDQTDEGLSKRNYKQNYKEFINIIGNNVSPIYIQFLKVRQRLGVIKRYLTKR